MNSSLVTIIIVNWNGKELLAECLDSVLRSTYKPIEILLVDNGSTDGSIELIKSEYPFINLLENGTNLGYAEGNNRGIPHSKGKYVAILNNDIVVEPTWLNKPIGYFENDSRLGMVSCRQMNYYDHSLIDSLFHYPAPDLTFARIGHGAMFDPGSWHNVPGYVIAPNGGSGIYRKEMFEQLGGFDSSFFAYHEETDLSMRAFLNGWKCLFVPESVVYHKDSASFKKTNGTNRYFHARNKLWFLFKYFPLSFIVTHFSGFFLEELRIIKWTVFKEKVPFLYLKARFDGLIGLAKYYSLRKKYVRVFIEHSQQYVRLEKEKLLPLNK